MAEPARPEVRYTAFLSYSHRDAAAAGRLHRRLEAYRLPRRLAGSQTARGIVPARLWPIFRDREELPAATDLSETVREALAQSGALIVLCSPYSAESLWVAEEIETFRRLHPDRPILAAILDGDPPDCFPAALRAFGQDGTWHEPLATDLRRGRDGAHLGLLKLVAGITGVGLDALVQRDAARKIRRVMAVTGAAVVAMLIMAALALVALDARREAERQRAEAEGLVEFMLTDLREKLRGVGRLDIMTAVNQRALAHYGRQEQLDELSPDALERRARVLHAIGEDDIMQSNFTSALAAFREAHRTTASLLAIAPNDPVRIFAHAQSDYWVGRVHELRQEWPETQRYYTRYAEAAERLVSLAPDDPDYMMEMGYGAMNLGVARLRGAGDARSAEGYFEQAVRWFGRAATARHDDPAALREQANAYASLAETHFSRRQWPQALAAYRRQHIIARRVHQAEPSNVEDVFRLTIAERAVALLSVRQGDAATYRALLESAYRRAARLVAHDPANLEWRLLKAKIECDVLANPGHSIRSLPRPEARRRASAAISALRNEQNPRISELSRCAFE